jgi:hypothetical protein
MGQCVSVDSVYTTCDVKQIEDRNVLFGVKQITEDIIWPTHRRIIKKYTPFISYDREKYKQILKEKIKEYA